MRAEREALPYAMEQVTLKLTSVKQSNVACGSRGQAFVPGSATQFVPRGLGWHSQILVGAAGRWRQDGAGHPGWLPWPVMLAVGWVLRWAVFGSAPLWLHQPGGWTFRLAGLPTEAGRNYVVL